MRIGRPASSSILGVIIDRSNLPSFSISSLISSKVQSLIVCGAAALAVGGATGGASTTGVSLAGAGAGFSAAALVLSPVLEVTGCLTGRPCDEENPDSSQPAQARSAPASS